MNTSRLSLILIISNIGCFLIGFWFGLRLAIPIYLSYWFERSAVLAIVGAVLLVISGLLFMRPDHK